MQWLPLLATVLAFPMLPWHPTLTILPALTIPLPPSLCPAFRGWCTSEFGPKPSATVPACPGQPRVPVPKLHLLLDLPSELQPQLPRGYPCWSSHRGLKSTMSNMELIILSSSKPAPLPLSSSPRHQRQKPGVIPSNVNSTRTETLFPYLFLTLYFKHLGPFLAIGVPNKYLLNKCLPCPYIHKPSPRPVYSAS